SMMSSVRVADLTLPEIDPLLPAIDRPFPSRNLSVRHRSAYISYMRNERNREIWLPQHSGAAAPDIRR
ncbi:MAG TPA: hypothetical protein VLA37_13015, partial [Sphingomonadaceae bacterium]|nr:hypothetical protein [Sphingomonadaceae bacterium]